MESLLWSSRQYLLVGIVTNRDSPLRKKCSIDAVADVMTGTNLIVTQDGADFDKGRATAPRAPHRKAARRGRRTASSSASSPTATSSSSAVPQRPARTSGAAVRAAAVGSRHDTIDRDERWSMPGRCASSSIRRTATAGRDRHAGQVKAAFPQIDVVCGNIATRRCRQGLVKAGADARQSGHRSRVRFAPPA